MSEDSMVAGPTAMEIAEFARYLGMDPAMDSNLLWIAEEALCSPLPENWEEAVRKDGTPYYFNKKENKSTNKHPLEDFYRSLYTEMKEIQATQAESSQAEAVVPGGAPGSTAEALVLASEHAEPVVRRFVTPNEVRDMATYLGIDTINEFNLLHIAHAAVLAPLPSNWLEFEDEDGNPYYYDRNTLRVTYRHPADEKYFKQVADERARMSSSGMSSLERRLLLMKDSKRKKVEEQGDEALYWMAFVDVHGTDYWYNFKTDRMTYYKPDVLSEMDEAAIMIQAVWRGKQWRQVASAMRGNKQWAFENAAATDIQRRFRGFKMRRLLERDREIAKLTSAAVRLQSTFRGYRCRVRWPGLKMELQSEQREKASIIIQAAMRRKLAMNRREKLMEERIRNNAAVIIQSAWRGTGPRKARRKLIIQKRENMAARDVQRVYRGHMGRKKRMEKEEEKYLHAMATKLQCAWRGRLGRIHGKQIVASKKIQAQWRGKSARTEFKKKLREREEDNAARKIQAGWHGKKGRRRHHARKREHAALKVQSHYRGHRCRSEKRHLRKQKASTHIAAGWRGHKDRKVVQQHKAAIEMQRAWRGFSTRREVAKRQEAADYLSKVMRGYMARQLVKLMVRRKVQNMQASKIQALARGRKKRKMFKEMQDSHSASSSIQKAFKSRQNRKAAKEQRKKELAERASAASTIEKAAKRRLERKKAARQENAHKEDSAAVLIQAKHRKRLRQSAIQNQSATKIQSLYRGKQGRRQQLDKQFGGHAVKIQSRFRGRKSRRDQETQQTERAAIKIQAMQRGNAIRRMQTKRESTAAAVQIQAVYRGRTSRRQQELWANQGFAIKIQACVRGWLVRTETERGESRESGMSAVLIQSRFRGRKERKNIHVVREQREKEERERIKRELEQEERDRQELLRDIADVEDDLEQMDGNDEELQAEMEQLNDDTGKERPEDDNDNDEYEAMGGTDDDDDDDGDMAAEDDGERPSSGSSGGDPTLKEQLRHQYAVERLEMEGMAATIIQRHWRGWLARQYVATLWKDLKYSVEAQGISSIVSAYSGFIEGMQEEPREHLTQLQAKSAKGRAASAKRGQKQGMFPPVKSTSPKRGGSPPRNRPEDTSDPTLWPEMYVKPIWLTMSMLGGRSIENIVETQMLGRLYKILGEHLLDHGDMLAQHRYEEHVEFIEEYFVGCEVQYGLQNPEVQAAAEQLAMTTNIFAIKLLLSGKYQIALKMFKKAELLTDPHKYRYRRRGELRAWTFSNIAYYYYKRSKFSAALQYIQKAAKVHHATARLTSSSGVAEQRNYGVIMSNMATIYSKLGRHDYSIDYARRALELVAGSSPGGGGREDDDPAAAVCYHNIAVEHVYLFSYKDAVGVEVRAAKLASSLEASHPWKQQMDTAKDVSHALLNRQRGKSKSTEIDGGMPGARPRATSAGRPGGPRQGSAGRPKTAPDEQQFQRPQGQAERPRTSESGTRRGLRRPQGQRRAASASRSARGQAGKPSPQERPPSSSSIRPTSSQRSNIPVVTDAGLPDAWGLEDGTGPPKELAYTVFVYTGDVRGADTDANVFIELHGRNDTSGRRRLHASWKNCFGRGSIDEFALSCVDLGELEAIQVGHDSPTLNSGWFLDRVVVADSVGRHWEFDARQWLDKHEPNGVTEVTLRGQRLADEGGAESEAAEGGGNHSGGGSGGSRSRSSSREPLVPLRPTASENSRSRSGSSQSQRRRRSGSGGRRSAERGQREGSPDSSAELLKGGSPDAGASRRQLPSPHGRQDLVCYTVRIRTGDVRGAGTDANVSVTLYGDLGVSERQPLSDARRKSFERGQTDTFEVEDHDIGSLTKLRLEHDGSGVRPGWFLESVSVTSEETGQVWAFPCSQWLDATKGDGEISRELYPVV